MRIRCILGFHKWKPWDKVVEDYVGLKFRFCCDCNQMQCRSIYGKEAAPDDANKTTIQDLSE